MDKDSTSRRQEQVVLTASEETCCFCGGSLWITQHRTRTVEGLDASIHQACRDKRCRHCGAERIYRAPEDLRLALPGHVLGLDVILYIGENHVDRGGALCAIGRDLNDRGVPIHQTTVGKKLRDFLALARAARGDEEAVRAKLEAQGGLLLMADGVQFDSTSPVLYLVWDALSGTPLFGERKMFRGKDDLVPLLERVKAMRVPVIGAVSDKEKGLVPAIAEVFPDIPHQLCQAHFLKNCALHLASDLAALGRSVDRRRKEVRDVAGRLKESAEVGAEGGQPKQLAEEGLVQELCSAAVLATRASGKAPLNPPELVRHTRLEAVCGAAERAARKKGGRFPSSTPSSQRLP